MQLEYLFLTISIFFLCMTVFFIFKAPRFVDKLEAILVCILGILLYSSLSSLYYMGETELPAILFMAFLIFLWAMIFFIFREPKLMEKKQAIIICLLGVLAYGSLFGVAHVNINENNKIEIVQDKAKTNKSSGQNKVVEASKNTDKNDKGLIIGDTDSKIYHVPGSTYYEKEKKKESNNMYFKTIEEATKAGYRAPKK